MGTGSSKDTDGVSHGREGENLDQGGGQLYVSLKMENYKLKGELIPHVYGSVPLVGSWDSSKAVSIFVQLIMLSLFLVFGFNFIDCCCCWTLDIYSLLWNVNQPQCGN